MNFRTTLMLLVLAAAGGIFVWLDYTQSRLLPFLPRPAEAANAGTTDSLRTELTAANLKRITIIQKDRQVLLERGATGDWTLPGKWPVRQAEANHLVGLLTGLHSRFAPLPVTDAAALKLYGLDQPAATLKILLQNGKELTLVFGEEPSERNRFSRATYVRLDDRNEVLRLAPNLLIVLTRPQDHYQQRRLFPHERVAKDADSQEKVDQLLADSIVVKDGAKSYTLARRGDDWELRDPNGAVHDRADPDKLKTILTAVPDLWADQFVYEPKKDLGEYGLKDPVQSIAVSRAGGDTATLLIGKQARMKTRSVTRPAPNLGGPPMPPQKEIVHEEYRYAKLVNNDQIFEVKADKFKDLFTTADTLRDARLARFKTEEVRRVEIAQGGQTIVLAKDQERWRLEKPITGDADSSKITEILDKLAAAEARDKDVIDKADPKTYNLDKPSATIKIAVEQEVKGSGDTKTKKNREFTFTLGKHDADAKKLYVRLEGWPRVNALEDSLAKLVQRPALAYRGRRVLDFSSLDVAKLEVHRGQESYVLEQTKDQWRLTAPAQAEIDTSKAGQLAGDLSRLEVVEFVSDSPSPQELEQTYGLAKPAVTVKITLTDAKKPPETLLIGKQRADKQEYFARLQSKPGVFAVKKELRDLIDQDSLALRGLQLWQLIADDLGEIRVRKDGPEYVLKRDGQNWKISGPFDAQAVADKSRALADELAGPRAEKYVAHVAKNLADYGLDKPYLTLVIHEVDKSKPGEKAAAKPRVIHAGKLTDKDAKTRFARLEGSDGVFVLGDKLLAAADHGPLDYLDTNLLTIDSKTIERITVTQAGGQVLLTRQGDAWQVGNGAGVTLPADSDVLAAVLGIWSNLRAVRHADYGAKIDLARYGLDKPFATIQVNKKATGTATAAGPAEHKLLLGKLVDNTPGERYARLDQQPAVVVLSSGAVSDLAQDYLAFANRSILKLTATEITRIERRIGQETLDVARQGPKWQLTRPASQAADGPTMDALIEQLAGLRAQRVAAYQPKDLKPFGLEAPECILTIGLTAAGGKSSTHVVKVGKLTAGQRHAQVDNSPAVVVLAESLTSSLLAPVLKFRDHELARITDVDRAVVQRGSRRVVFARKDSTWKMTEPIAAEAESLDLDDLVGGLARLRAEEIVAEKPADLKPYGLDKPEARWQFQSGTKPPATLLIGGFDKGRGQADGGRCYARLEGSDLVVLLSQQLSTRVLAEYRNKNVWTSAPDASQVETVRFGYAANPFVLEKVDNDWRVAGKGGLKVKADAVKEVLDAVAGLKAARYVQDRGVDLKLYGLEPPQLILELQAPSGKKLLQIGRPEGESKRYYARVPDNSDAPVFVISEADSQRIVRSLPTLVEAQPKPADKAR